MMMHMMVQVGFVKTTTELRQRKTWERQRVHSQSLRVQCESL